MSEKQEFRGYAAALPLLRAARAAYRAETYGVTHHCGDVVIIGRVNGMGERDQNGAYIGIAIQSGGYRETFKISVGAASVLQVELDGVLNP